MNIDQLIEHLEEYRDLLGGDTEVRLMTQQHWPLEYRITGICSGEEINEFDDEFEDDDDLQDGDVSDDGLVYIVKGQQLGYGTKWAWDIANKRRNAGRPRSACVARRWFAGPDDGSHSIQTNGDQNDDDQDQNYQGHDDRT